MEEKEKTNYFSFLSISFFFCYHHCCNHGEAHGRGNWRRLSVCNYGCNHLSLAMAVGCRLAWVTLAGWTKGPGCTSKPRHHVKSLCRAVPCLTQTSLLSCTSRLLIPLSMPNDNDRPICQIIDMNHLYFVPEQLAADRCQKGQTGTAH